MDNSVRFRTCLVANSKCGIDVSAIVDYFEEEGEPVDEKK